MRSDQAPMPLLLRMLVTLGRLPLRLGVGRITQLVYGSTAASPRRWRGLVRRRDGLRMFAGTVGHIEREVLLRGVWEPAVNRLIELAVPRGGCAVDAGANIGCHTLTMARCTGPTGVVLAMEPNPRVRADLQKNLQANAFAHVEVLGSALGETRGTAQLKMPTLDDSTGTNQGLSSVMALETPADVVEVEMTTLDEILAERPQCRPSFVKIDVQGYDAKVIRGMKALLARERPVIAFEYEDWAWRLSGETLAGLGSWLQTMDYGIWHLMLDGDNLTLHALDAATIQHADCVAVHRSFDPAAIGIAR